MLAMTVTTNSVCSKLFCPRLFAFQSLVFTFSSNFVNAISVWMQDVGFCLCENNERIQF